MTFMAYRNRASCYFHLGQLDDAIADCRQVVRLHPGDANGHMFLADILERLGKPDEAVAACREAVRVQPDNPVVHCNLGTFLADKGEVEEATASYLRFISILWGETPLALRQDAQNLNKDAQGLNNFAWRWPGTSPRSVTKPRRSN